MIWYNALFGLRGRLNRKGFWQGVAINLFFLFVVANFLENLTAYQPILFAPLAVSFYIFIALGVKRLHDRNRSGKNALILWIIPLCLGSLPFSAPESTEAWLVGVLMPMLVMTLVTIEWGFFKSDPNPNQYGEKGLSFRLK